MPGNKFKISTMKLKLLILFIITVSFYGCASQKITGSWADPDIKSFGPYTKAFVIVMTQNKDANYFIESQMVKTLISRGFKAVKSNDIYPPGFSVIKDFTREQLIESIKRTGCDAVLTLALLDARSVESYHPGTSYTPYSYGHYGSFYGYYGYNYPQVYSPGYYSVDKDFFLETNLYDLVSDKLLWSVQSEASNPENLEEWFKKYSVLLINHIEKNGLSMK